MGRLTDLPGAFSFPRRIAFDGRIGCPEKKGKTMKIASRLFASSLLVGAAMIAAPATAATSINFDNGTNGASVGSFYSALGITFGNASFTDNFGLAGSSGALGIAATAGGFQPTPNSPITATFSSAVGSIGIRGIDVGQNGIRLEAYNSANVLVAFDQYFGPDVGVGTFRDLFVTGAGITSFKLFQPVNVTGDGVLFDNLTFDVAAPGVPEPATWAMMMLGFGAMGAALRRRPSVKARVRFT